MNENKINTTVDDVFKTTPTGSVDSSIGNAFYGINHRLQPGAVPINKDGTGLTFFTRPQLNLSTANVRHVREFLPLLNTTDESIQRIVRTYLDPRLYDSGILSPKVDEKNIFIPILTNHLLSCTGWPDPTTEQHISKPGAYKEVFGITDGTIDRYSAFDITATFRNMKGDPITLLFNTWLNYQTKVFEGIMSPYPDFIIENEIDYNTRIWRLVLDQNKKFVTKIACTGASFPVSVPLGSAFNFEHDKPFNQNNESLAINFKCFGFCYNDDILIHEFNKAVGIFNPDMNEGIFSYTGKTYKPGNIDQMMQKIPAQSIALFNNRGYPRINPGSYELEWYVTKQIYEDVMSGYLKHMNALDSYTNQTENNIRRYGTSDPSQGD